MESWKFRIELFRVFAGIIKPLFKKIRRYYWGRDRTAPAKALAQKQGRSYALEDLIYTQKDAFKKKLQSKMVGFLLNGPFWCQNR